jgi:hypothetical protein
MREERIDAKTIDGKGNLDVIARSPRTSFFGFKGDEAI